METSASFEARSAPLLYPTDSQSDIFELQHPFEVAGLRHEEMGGQDLLDDSTHLGQREMRLTPATAFVLQKAVGDGRQDDVALPARQAAALEVIESEFVFELLILLFDGPPLVRELDERAQEAPWMAGPPGSSGHGRRPRVPARRATRLRAPVVGPPASRGRA